MDVVCSPKDHTFKWNGSRWLCEHCGKIRIGPYGSKGEVAARWAEVARLRATGLSASRIGSIVHMTKSGVCRTLRDMRARGYTQ